MNGLEAVAALRPVLTMLRARDEVSPAEVVAAVSFALGFETISMKRARAGAAGGRASVESRRSSEGTAQPKQNRSKPPSASEAKPEANSPMLRPEPPKQTRSTSPVGSEANLPRPSSPPGPPSDSLPPSDLPKAAAASAEGPVENRAEKLSGAAPRDWSKNPPKSLDEAREMPLEARCKHVLDRPDRAQWIQPEQWAEVRLAASAFREAAKKRMPLGTFNSDSGVKRLVELYAAGLTAEEVCGVIPAVVASAWFKSDPPKDLGSLTLSVVRRALDAQPAPAIGGLPRAMFGGGP